MVLVFGIIRLILITTLVSLGGAEVLVWTMRDNPEPEPEEEIMEQEEEDMIKTEIDIAIETVSIGEISEEMEVDGI